MKPGIGVNSVELLKLLATACVGAAVVVGVVWAFYQLMVAMEALS